MEAADSPEEAVCRAEARTWLATHVGPYRVDANPASPPLVFADVSETAHVQRGRTWPRRLFDAGWAGLGWSAHFGGRDLPIPLRAIGAVEAAAGGAPPPINLIGEGMAGPTPMAHGSEEQQHRFLAPVLTGEEIWCQRSASPTPAPWPR